MSFVTLARPDDTLIAVNPDHVLHCEPGPRATGTRLVFGNQTYQDVRDPLPAVVEALNSGQQRGA